MTEWDVFIALSAIVSFIIALIGALKKYVADPINSLDKTLVRTNAKLEVLQKSDIDQNRILDKYGNELKDHDTRITVVENTLYLKDRA